jgi:hypothetical protein
MNGERRAWYLCIPCQGQNTDHVKDMSVTCHCLPPYVRCPVTTSLVSKLSTALTSRTQQKTQPPVVESTCTLTAQAALQSNEFLIGVHWLLVINI